MQLTLATTEVSVLESEVQKAIDRIVRNNCHRWLIGVTNNPEEAVEKYRYPRYWKHWKVESTEEARLILDHFREQGCLARLSSEEEDGSSIAKAAYIYIY